ncbi:MAG: Gfo/Idh/MocA family oxidoreductase [Lentisphaeria bacterium]|nr:Gfo/Idh/MocA family oxidoreductase [Lentisphaeria bacterium]NQZ69103.1 Gfo/Idh/MocA family oxidoreductase [Lentisphaeria bacterium]
MAKFKKASDIKVGVIGYGGAFNMGRNHLHEMKSAGMTPVAVAEIDESRLAVAEDDFPGIETYNNVAKMLKKSDVNLITIITPHNTHAKLALQCLKAGKNVCCEKPLAITTKECDAMFAEAKKQKLVISTYHNRHWDGCALAAVENVVKNKSIGKIVSIDIAWGGYGKPGDWWRSSKTISGGILYDWGVHLLEYSLQIIQDDLVEVSGFAHNGFWGPQTAWKKDCNEDDATAIARFKSGAYIKLNITQLDLTKRPYTIQVRGTKGAYDFGLSDYQLTTMNDDGTLSITKGSSPPGQSHKFYKNIANHLTKGTKLVITPEWSRKPIHILDLAVQSAKKGHAIKATYK